MGEFPAGEDVVGLGGEGVVGYRGGEGGEFLAGADVLGHRAFHGGGGRVAYFLRAFAGGGGVVGGERGVVPGEGELPGADGAAVDGVFVVDEPDDREPIAGEAVVLAVGGGGEEEAQRGDLRQ